MNNFKFGRGYVDHKGKLFLDAGNVFAPYVPLQLTPVSEFIPKWTDMTIDGTLYKFPSLVEFKSSSLTWADEVNNSWR